jgi:hypothetical protein
MVRNNMEMPFEEIYERMQKVYDEAEELEGKKLKVFEMLFEEVRTMRESDSTPEKLSVKYNSVCGLQEAYNRRQKALLSRK